MTKYIILLHTPKKRVVVYQGTDYVRAMETIMRYQDYCHGDDDKNWITAWKQEVSEPSQIFTSLSDMLEQDGATFTKKPLDETKFYKWWETGENEI